MHRHSTKKNQSSVLALALVVAILAMFTILSVRLRAQGADTTPPVITGVGTSAFTSTTATITWTTDEPADGMVGYGISNAYEQWSSFDSTLTTTHTIFISGLTPGGLYRYQVKSKDAAGNVAVSEEKIVQPPPLPPPADAVPTITLTVTPTNTQAGHRPGGRSYFTTTVSDDKLLKSVIVTTSPMMHSGSPNTLYQCIDKTTCEEKVYIIVPSNAGENFVTITATDSANQVATKTVTFQAPACSTDADCGGNGSIQWAGASYCSGENNHINQYGVGPTCNSGTCNTESKSYVKQQCGSGQNCTYGANGVNMCIAQPGACTPGAQITSVCSCGANTAYNYPYDWRVSNSPTFCCLSGGTYYTVSPGPCSIVSAPSPAQTTSTQSTTPRTSSAATLTMPASSQATTTSTAAPATYSAGTSVLPLTPGVPAALPSVTLPTAAIKQTEHAPQTTVAPKLRASQIRTLTMRKKVILRQIDSLTRTAKRQGHAEALAELQEMHAEVSAFTPVDRSAYENITDWTDELGAVQAELRLSAKPVILKKKSKAT